MSRVAHLWAVGYDDTNRAEQVRDEVTRLAVDRRLLLLLDIAVVVRHADGAFTFNRKPFSDVRSGTGAHGLLAFLSRLAMAVPLLTDAAVGALMDPFDSAVLHEVGIDEEFVRDVEAIISPGSSVLFVLDEEGHLEETIKAIRGMGGKVLKTNVNLERARLIQSTLSDNSAEPDTG